MTTVFVEQHLAIPVGLLNMCFSKHFNIFNFQVLPHPTCHISDITCFAGQIFEDQALPHHFRSCLILYIQCHISHITSLMSHVTCHMSHVTCNMSHITYFIIYLFRHGKRQFSCTSMIRSKTILPEKVRKFQQKLICNKTV